jgi:hypothetical protein
MSLITSIGGAESESFTQLDYAEDYIENICGGAENVRASWTGKTEFQKEYALAQACEILGYLPLRSMKAFRNQRLPFPRKHQSDPWSIPQEVIHASILIAYDVVAPGMDSANTLSTSGSFTGQGPVTGVSLGVLSVSFGQPMQTGPNMLLQILKGSPFQIYSLLKPHITQFKSRRILNTDEKAILDAELLTTTT